MSRVGYYRYKTDTLVAAEVTKNITIYVNAIPVVTHVININQFCDDEKFIKYLDKEGQYRFVSFNKYWEGRNNPESLGEVNKFITSILDAQSNINQIGYKNNKILTLTKTNITSEQLNEFQNILTSPRVYLLIGPEDGLKDWLLVKARGADNIYRTKKKSTTDFVIDIELPEDFSQTMI